MHLAAYNNAEKCMEALIQHILHNSKTLTNQQVQMIMMESGSEYDVIQQINRRALLKEWVNQPTLNFVLPSSQQLLNSNTP